MSYNDYPFTGRHAHLKPGEIFVWDTPAFVVNIVQSPFGEGPPQLLIQVWNGEQMFREADVEWYGEGSVLDLVFSGWMP